MGRRNLVVLALVILSAILFYNMDFNERDYYKVMRVLDGDTVEIENGIRIRLMGLNTPEKNRFLAEEAKVYLENLVLNKKVKFVSMGGDRYGRVLAYIFVNKKNVNELILSQGLANLYYYDKDEYYNHLVSAERFARENELGIWEKSSSFGCLKLLELDYLDIGDEDFETLILENICEERLFVGIKDDANHYYEREIDKGLFVEEFRNIFNDDGDSLYVWDDEGKLLLFYRY